MPIYATMIDTPPLSITIPSSDDQEDVNRSGLTGPCDDNDDDHDGVNSQNHEGKFDRTIAMIDPQFKFKIDDQQPRLSSSGISNEIVIATAPIKEKKQVVQDRIELKQNIVHQKKLLAEKQELLHLKLQIAKHKKMLHLLSTKLTKSQVENESLKVEKVSLVNELSLARDVIERDVVVAVNNDDVEEQSTSMYGRFSLRGVGDNNNTNYGRGGSMQMLLDRNARLMAENARLQVSQDDVRKSFRSHIKFTRSISRADKEAVADLKRENGTLRKSLRQQQQQQRHPHKVVVNYSAARNSVQLSENEDTSKTDLTADDNTSDENQDDNDSAVKHTIKLCVLCDSKHNTKYKDIKIDDKDIKEEDGRIDIDKKNRDLVENDVAPNNGRRMLEELLVDFGECRRRPRGTVQRWCSLKA